VRKETLPAVVRRRGHLLFAPSLIKEYWTEAVERFSRPPLLLSKAWGSMVWLWVATTVQRRTRVGAWGSVFEDVSLGSVFVEKCE
jgi:hypothetical protein